MRLLFFLVLLFTTLSLTAQSLRLSELYTDHAILQREAPHRLWGWARPATRVSVEIDGETLTAMAGKDGRWSVTLPARPAGGPYALRVRSGKETVELRDLYFGDVYLLSGQSNMEWRLEQSDPEGGRARAIADPLIREIKVARSSSVLPRRELDVQWPWRPGTAEQMGTFSGVGAYFAHHLRDTFEQDVPIGLVHASWGGSRIEPWIEGSQQGLDPAGAAAQVSDFQQLAGREALDRYAREFGGTPPTEDRGEELGYLRDDFDDSDWGSVDVPGLWESRGYPNVNGYVYYRYTFTLTAEQAAGSATLHLGPIDDGDWTYVNGRPVGSTPNSYDLPRVYAVEDGLLRAGENTLAIRVFDGMGGGGLYGAPELLRLETGAGDVPLAGTWRFRFGKWEVDTRPQHTPTLLYNAMIAPLEGLPLSGVLWYQGESNAGPGDAAAYADQMRTLIGSWRQHFGNPTLPFYWVQLANYQAEPVTANEPGWALLRASQTAALDVPYTGQAVITDLGEADDIHPKNKWDVGFRLALHAARDIYDQPVFATAPLATGAEATDGGVTLSFSGLTGDRRLVGRRRAGDRYGYLRGFTVEDENGEWQWSRAFLSNDGRRIHLPAPENGRALRRVRYAWSNNPAAANVYSSDGLPLTPFELIVTND